MQIRGILTYITLHHMDTYTHISNGVIIKEVHECKKEGYITCHSLNPDPKFSDFDVPLREVYGIYRVLMCLSAK